MTKLKIKVTKEILEKSKFCGGSLQNCAIALAVRDIFPRATVVGPYMRPFGQIDSFTKEPPLYHLVIYLPNECSDFVCTFDELSPDMRVEMEELEFEIDIPDNVLGQVNIDELKPLLVNHPTLELV